MDTSLEAVELIASATEQTLRLMQAGGRVFGKE